MAEGGQPPIVYHIENLGTLNVATEQNVTNISKSPIGSIAISSKSGERRDQALAENDGSEQTGSDSVSGSKQQGKQQEGNETVITWLKNGSFGLYVNNPLQMGAKVYRGVQKLFSNRRRDVAIKLLAFQKKNRGEIDVLLKLQHPNIVQIIDAGDHLGAVHWIYIVMELCSQNLQSYIDENKNESPDFKKLFSFSKQLVAGLAYLHQNKVVHRDLKPENVLISMCKKFIKLADFGMSKEIPKNRSVVTVTTIGAGTEGYRPPETYKEGTHISPSLDIFPLGLILHFLFTNGQHPFGSDKYDWSYNIRKNKNLDLSQIPDFEEPNVLKKSQLVELLNRMIRHEPRDRPTADEVKNAPFFKDLLQEEGKIIDGQVAAIDISSPRTTPPAREAAKDSKLSMNPGNAPDSCSSLQIPATCVQGDAAIEGNKKDKKGKKKGRKVKMSKADIHILGDSRHVGYAGWDPNKGFDINKVSPALKSLFKQAGINDSQLQDKDTAQFIHDFIEKNGGINAVIKSQVVGLPPPPPPPARRHSSAWPSPPPSRDRNRPLSYPSSMGSPLSLPSRTPVLAAPASPPSGSSLSFKSNEKRPDLEPQPGREA